MIYMLQLVGECLKSLLYGYFGQFGVHGYFSLSDIVFDIYNKIGEVGYLSLKMSLLFVSIFSHAN
jgi:hypothetical protein